MNRISLAGDYAASLLKQGVSFSAACNNAAARYSCSWKDVQMELTRRSREKRQMKEAQQKLW